MAATCRLGRGEPAPVPALPPDIQGPRPHRRLVLRHRGGHRTLRQDGLQVQTGVY